jgi:hypothetical protein
MDGSQCSINCPKINGGGTLVNRLEVMPVEGSEGRGVRFSGSGHYGRLLAGTTGPLGMVAVEGIEPPARGL